MNEIMRNSDQRIQPLVAKINDMLLVQTQVFLGIDGMAASGKTTLAQRLASVFDANVIHMDDFFLPKALRTAERDNEIGGNIHYERFSEEVILGLSKGCPFEYRVFNCFQMEYVDVRQIFTKPLTIIEGAYCLHPRFINIYDLKVFSQVTETEQIKRITKRNGSDLEKFLKIWIPKENQFFQHFCIKEQCDLII